MKRGLSTGVAVAALALTAVFLVTEVGALSISTIAVTFSGVTLDGSPQTVTGSTSAWRVEATGETGGWNVTIASTDLSAAGKTIPVANFQSRLLDANISWISGDTNLPLSSQTAFASLSEAATKIASANAGEGNGVYDLTPDFRLTVPAETYTGSYTATITVAVNTGP